MLIELIGNSRAIVALREEVGRLLQRPLGGRSLPPILIEGETGTGKGLLAGAIHRAGPRGAGPFVAVNCAAIPETLLEAELFGFERGAFTDARQAKPGLVETAHRGTLFLDEIGLLPGTLQGKFLTVLEEGVVRRLGRTRSQSVDMAILTATSEDLQRAVREHRFSEALYHRLSVLTLRLPPLRERGADIVLLAEHWLARAAADYGVPIKTLSPEARAALLAYAWPGNVRELRNRMERVTLVAQPGLVTPDMLGLTTAPRVELREAAAPLDAPGRSERPGGAERETLVDVLTQTGWNITRAAARLGVPPSTLRYRLRKYGLLGEPLSGVGPPSGAPESTPGPESSVTAATAPDAKDQPPPPPSTVRPIPEAGRRQLTVMLCGLAHSAGPSGPLDPDDLHDLIRDAQDTCADVIGRFEGHAAPYLDDRLLVYFGHPLAHEDDARRAVHAALGIVEAIRALSNRLEGERGVRVTVRLGIHTGLVVLGDSGRGDWREHVAVGETPHVALHLHEIAEPDTVVISPATHRLIEGYFVCQALGLHTLPAASQPLPVYRVIRENAARSRLDAALTAGFTPLVGRQQEVGLLLERWEQAKDGLGHVVLLSGEAGIGKSRLVQAFDERIAGEPHTRLAYYCSPYYQNSALYPVIDNLQRRLQFEREDSLPEKLSKLEAALAGSGLATEEAVSLFAALLSLPLPEERRGPLTATPQRLKQKTLEAVLAWLLKEAERQVTLSVWEDLQWVDPSTLELLDLLIEEVPTARLLLLLTFRPEFAHPWTTRSHLTHISLNRLSRGHAEVMVEKVAKGRAMPAEVLQQLIAKTDGVPLFVEELTKMVLESRLLPERSGAVTGPLPPLAIPSTLHDSLMARLDRLGPGKEAVQLGATLGREFSYELIHAVSPMDEVTLQRELAQLVEAELLYRKGLPPQARYIFKHALIQDAAYQSLLRSRKREYHGRIAQVLEGRFPEAREIDPELLAHHYTEAGLKKDAIDYWHRAGQRALERSAIAEAIGHVSRGLALLETLPDTPDRPRQELALQLTLGAALLTIKEYTAPDVEKVYARARELRPHVGDSPQLFSALFGLWRFHISRAELNQAHELGQECFALARRSDDFAFLLQAHFALGVSSLNLGQFASALTDLEHALALYDPQQHSGLAFLQGTDPGVACRCYAARARWFLGYPDQALARSQEALTLAQQSSHTATLGYAIHLASALHTYRREVHLVRQLAEAAIALANEHGFERWGASGLMRRGWALAEQGAAGEGIEQLRQGLVTWGSQLGRSHFLALLSEAYGKGGQVDAGLQVLDEALAIAQGKSERHYEAELYRLKGELLLQRDAGSSHAEADVCFREAIAIARRQGARSLQLRAVTSASRLWQRQGKRTEARQMLGEIHGWFTEGFDTSDLREARAQLEALA